MLDGGFAAWIAAGRPVEPGRRRPAPGRHRGRTRAACRSWTPTAPAALARDGVLLDARVGPRYRGETEPIDPVAGHIPGAVNLPAAELTGPDGRLLPADAAARGLRRGGVGRRRSRSAPTAAPA